MPYSMTPQTGAATTLVAEPVATRIESAGAMVMEQQPLSSRMEAMPATTYSAAAPAATYIAGPQSGVMVGGTTMMGGAVPQQEGFLQHAMHTVGNAIGLGGSQATPTTTYVQ